MNTKSVAFVAIAASIVLGLSGCGSSSSPEAAPKTSVPSTGSSTAANVSAPIGRPAGVPDPASPPVAEPVDAPAPVPVPVVTPAPAPASPPAVDPAPDGSGHGLCFDVNSGLANSAISSLGAPPYGGNWNVEGGSGDAIQDGCSGVLSWMTVDWNGIHPGTHILFFTNGTYLGTATSKPYGYTEMLGKTRNTVSVQYKWAKPEDALCCPTGGPSVVMFTLNGTSVQATGQFPPDK